MAAVTATDGLQLCVMAVGSHFLDSQGCTFDEIQAAGFSVDERVEVQFDDTGQGVAKAIAATVSGATDALIRQQPDIVVLLGDRFEIIASALAATVLRIPIAHIAGGDVTIGAYDESFRHSLTKLSHIHFTTNPDATARVRQLGEELWRIHEVGSPGIDALLSTDWLPRDTLEERLNWSFRPRNILVTLHPVTLQPRSGRQHAKELVAALEELPENVGIVVTGTNVDSEGSEINHLLEEYCARNSPRAVHVLSLGHRAYVSLLAEVDVVVGNSSSGLYEAPSLQTTTVDIGLRQVGRVRAGSVIHCEPDATAIGKAIHEALGRERVLVENPYGAGHAARSIADVLRAIPDRETLLLKKFVDQSQVCG